MLVGLDSRSSLIAGAIAMWLCVALPLSFRLRKAKWISQRVWRRFHWFGYAVWVLALVSRHRGRHRTRGSPFALAAYGGAAGVVALAGLLPARRQRGAAGPPRPPLASRTERAAARDRAAPSRAGPARRTAPRATSAAAAPTAPAPLGSRPRRGRGRRGPRRRRRSTPSASRGIRRSSEFSTPWVSFSRGIASRIATRAAGRPSRRTSACAALTCAAWVHASFGSVAASRPSAIWSGSTPATAAVRTGPARDRSGPRARAARPAPPSRARA